MPNPAKSIRPFEGLVVGNGGNEENSFYGVPRTRFSGVCLLESSTSERSGNLFPEKNGLETKDGYECKVLYMLIHTVCLAN